MSRASSASAGQATAAPDKANTVSQPSEPAINGSHRVFGLDGASDRPGYSSYRATSRSPSPYRRRRTRSPSPYRRARDADRSPSPYRRRLPHHKRKASPARGSRPDKRLHTDPDRHGARTARAGPISYAEVEHPNPVPTFQHGLSLGHERRAPEREDRTDAASSTTDTAIHVDVLAPVEEKVPTQESREEKRRRWAAIRAAAEQQKPKGQLIHQAILTSASEAATPHTAPPSACADSPISPFTAPHNGDLDSVPASPDVMLIDKQGNHSVASSPAAHSPAAADYDPVQDMLDDRERAAQKSQLAELSSDAYHEKDDRTLSTLTAEKSVPMKKQEKEFDMFASDDEDEDEDVETKATETSAPARGTVLDEKMLDNWDDPEGYYKLISNELVNGGRYRLIKALGRGVFANVAQAEEVQTEDGDPKRKLVAVKMIRRNELMRKASQKEMDFLRKVNEADPQDKRHIIRLLGSFDHKGHLCIVFEHMSKNLRDLLKEETNGHGLTLPAVRIYAKQMFLGLQHLLNCQVIHLDLKPDNVLVSADKKTIKLADFGTAVDKRDIIERTEYLVSRFYRAPEIILGMEVGYPVDMWAVGCTVYELWTGKILFTGRSNNQMIRAFMDCLGWPSEKLLRKGLANNVLENFELGPPLRFISREVDQHNKLSVRKIEQQKKIHRDLKSRVHEAARNISCGGPTVTELNDLADLLSASLHMNVDKRISPKEALVHKFLASKSTAPAKAASPAVVKAPLVKNGRTSMRR